MTRETREFVLGPVTTVEMPAGAEILTAQEKHGDVYLWALVDPKAPKENRTFEVYGVGNPIYYDMGVTRKYIATAQVNGCVLHVFEYTGI